MTSSRPYLLRAIYDWLLDNQMTPYLMVDATKPHVEVPTQFVKDGKIVLNINPQAVFGMAMGNRAVEFKAKFGGVPYHIYVPVSAIKAIYAFENGRGMVFNDEEDDHPPSGDGGGSDASDKSDKKPPFLRVVK